MFKLLIAKINYQIIIIMAAEVSPLKKLEEQLTCSVCLDFYTNPRSLPCLHSFCQGCLDLLPCAAADKDTISCPTCREVAKLPGPPGFPAAFHLNNLKEVYSLMEKASNQGEAMCEVCSQANANGYCKDCSQFLCNGCINMHKKFGGFASHKMLDLNEVAASGSQLVHEKEETSMNCSKHDESLKIFCETCQELICRDCTISDQHKNHEYSPIRDSYDKHRQILITTLNAVDQKLTNVTNKLTVLTNREREIKAQGEAVKEEIHQMVEEMIDELRESETKLTQNVDLAVDSKLQVILGQKKSVEVDSDQLRECKEYVEQNLEVDTYQQILLSKNQMMEQMNHVIQKFNAEDYNPLEICDIQFIKSNKISLHLIGDVMYSNTLKECKAKVHKKTYRGDNSLSFLLSIQLSNSTPLTIPISSLSCSVISTMHIAPINTTVSTTDHPGIYKICCPPVAHGCLKVNVQIINTQLKTFSIVVPFDPLLDTIAPVRVLEGCSNPFGVAISNEGHIIVSQFYSQSVTVLDKEGKQLKSFAAGKDVKFSHPHGVAVTPDNFILVADEHKIQKISMDGKLIACVGKQGSNSLQFNGPCGIAVSPITGQVYIADKYNHRVQVLNPDLSFAFAFGSNASSKGNFKHPRFISIDSRGMVYVSDRENYRIQKFTSKGKFISLFGTHGPDFGQLKRPEGIAIHNDLIYVADVLSDRISIFTMDGDFIHCFGSEGTNKDQFNGPCGITFDDEGFLYICDYHNNRVLVY
jgi:tripartite motif-containing protein 2/3/tripartite motif-containing protein 71